MSLPNYCFRFSIFILETLNFKKKGRYSYWQCSQYLELNPTCAFVFQVDLLPIMMRQKHSFGTFTNRKWSSSANDLKLKIIELRSTFRSPHYYLHLKSYKSLLLLHTYVRVLVALPRYSDIYLNNHR